MVAFIHGMASPIYFSDGSGYPSIGGWKQVNPSTPITFHP